jgi:hypothetical protein
MAYVVKDILDQLFKDGLNVMDDLSRKHGGQFTSQQFFKVIMQKNQSLYIELLTRCLAHPDNMPFNIAHQHLGKKLREVAVKAGYDGPFDEGRTEIDIFDNPTDRTVYRKK